VAYNRVAPARRLRLHRRIGERLEAGYGAQARELAAELAVHFEEGQLDQQAAQYREQAAENALQRSAYQEAAMHLNKGLALLETLPHTPERTRRELELLATLAPVLRNTRGQAAPEVRETYARAYALCQQVVDAPQRFPVLRGLWNYYNSRAELQAGYELGEQFFSLVQHQEDPALVLWGHCTLGMGDQYYGGAFASARDHYAQAMALYDRRQHRSLAFQYGQDPGVIALSFWGWMLWMLGYPDQALEKSHDALTLAKDLGHPYSLVAALNWAALLQQFRRQSQVVRELAEAVLALAREYGFVQRVAFGTILRGWALTEQGEAPEGIGQIHQGMTAFRATGQELFRPYSLALLAEACGKSGRAEDGLRVLDEALALAQARREIFWEPEMYRLKGELLLKVDDARRMVASAPETCFQQAIETARRRQARSLELRATTSLARLWQRQGKRSAARELLTPIYDWFTEGFDTAELQEARTLLDELW
jgi:predicted ATPase